ncbi:hypothetical protein RN001_002033 [Aquatica leii]|uniref:Uncharacterized protein n=1 Tax=Aquatica leii TaxID=1421715 RepID=A0AAN7PGL3_9COLE|nr:hypothetical protein RN001_002033 [Aquatica leii]
MAFRFDIDRLSKDELEYELKVRDVGTSGSVDKLRKSLRGVLALEKSGSSFVCSLKLDEKNELVACEQKVTELREVMSSFTDPACVSTTKKIETKFSHLFSRINRISSTDEGIAQKRSDLLASLAELIADYSSIKVDANESSSFYSQPVAPATESNSNSQHASSPTCFKTVNLTKFGRVSVIQFNHPVVRTMWCIAQFLERGYIQVGHHQS